MKDSLILIPRRFDPRDERQQEEGNRTSTASERTLTADEGEGLAGEILPEGEISMRRVRDEMMTDESMEEEGTASEREGRNPPPRTSTPRHSESSGGEKVVAKRPIPPISPRVEEEARRPTLLPGVKLPEVTAPATMSTASTKKSPTPTLPAAPARVTGVKRLNTTAVEPEDKRVARQSSPSPPPSPPPPVSPAKKTDVEKLPVVSTPTTVLEKVIESPPSEIVSSQQKLVPAPQQVVQQQQPERHAEKELTRPLEEPTGAVRKNRSFHLSAS